MKLLEYAFTGDSRTMTQNIYALGDAHVGALNCAETKLQHYVKLIASDKNNRWIGGGDLTDAIVMGDVKRFDPSILPDWLLENQSANSIRAKLTDTLTAQKERLFEILDPIRHQCLGLIEGNHEFTIMKYHNRDFMTELCEHFNAPNLTDCVFMRLRFQRRQAGGAVNKTATVRGFVCHGNGGGRTSGAEPNVLYRLAADKECEFILKGHSHSFCIHPPIPMLSVPSRGDMPENPIVYDKHAANWGSFLYTYQTGPSTYASRANYPVRPMYTVVVKITPFHETSGGITQPLIDMQQIRL